MSAAPAWRCYRPITPRTGALQEQPGGEAIRHDGSANVLVFLPDYRTDLIPCDALDAPLNIASGGHHSIDFDDSACQLRLITAHVWREGVLA